MLYLNTTKLLWCKNSFVKLNSIKLNKVHIRYEKANLIPNLYNNHLFMKTFYIHTKFKPLSLNYLLLLLNLTNNTYNIFKQQLILVNIIISYLSYKSINIKYVNTGINQQLSKMILLI